MQLFQQAFAPEGPDVSMATGGFQLLKGWNQIGDPKFDSGHLLAQLLVAEPSLSARPHMASDLPQRKKAGFCPVFSRSDTPLHMVHVNYFKWVAIVLHTQRDGFPQG